jgi:hypothetical protein
MKNVITVIALYIVMNTSVHAEPEYTLTPVENSVQCSNTDVAIGVGAGLVSGVVIGISTVAASPMIGAAGVVGWTGALSAPVLTGSTIGSVALSTGFTGSLIGLATYYGSCVTHAVMSE